MSFLPITLREQLPFRFISMRFESVASHWHDCFEMTCITEGSVSLTLENRKYELEEGDLYISNAGNAHEVVARSTNARLIAIQIPNTVFKSVYSKYCAGISEMTFKLTPEDREKESYKDIVHSMRKLQKEYKNKNANQLELCSIIFHIMGVVYGNYAVETDKLQEVVKREADTAPFMNVVGYIQEHFTEKITREDLGDIAGYSPVYISQLFQKKMGYTFTEYISMLRMNNAYNELLHTAKSVTRISDDNGFSSPKLFKKKFTEIYGLHPKLFRETHKNSTALGKEIGDVDVTRKSAYTISAGVEYDE